MTTTPGTFEGPVVCLSHRRRLTTVALPKDDSFGHVPFPRLLVPLFPVMNALRCPLGLCLGTWFELVLEPVASWQGATLHIAKCMWAPTVPTALCRPNLGLQLLEFAFLKFIPRSL